MLRPSAILNGKEEDMYLGKFRRKGLGNANPSYVAEGFLRCFAAKPFAQEVASLHLDSFRRLAAKKGCTCEGLAAQYVDSRVPSWHSCMFLHSLSHIMHHHFTQLAMRQIQFSVECLVSAAMT